MPRRMFFPVAAGIAAAVALGPQQGAAQGAHGGVFVDPVPVVRIGPPAGYEYAFTDGRLNPRRAERTARGDAQSAQVWTQSVPRREIPLPDSVREAAIAQIEGAAPARSSAPARASAPARGSTRGYVQIATFRHTGHAQRSARQVTQAGVPARVVTSGPYEVVLAGPFASAADRQRALQGARALGYSDAFVR